MANKNYKSTLYLALFITCVVAMLMSPAESITSYAGGINSDEARVISVASGTFTYQGKVYKAYSDYVSELYGYLADDDVDLDAQQADNAIKTIYANVKEGIDSEIIYEVKDEDDENNTDLDNLPPEDTDDASKKTAQTASDKEVEEMFRKIDEKQKEKKHYSDKVSATETDASIIISDKNLIISTGDSNIRLSANSRIIPEKYLSILIILSSIILAITVVCLIILSLNRCMRIKSQEIRRPRKGHTRRRRIRKVCRRILTVSISAAITLLFIILAVNVGLYNNNKIFQNIQNSGYFRYAYTEYLAETDKETKVLQYDDFVLKEKINIDSTLKKKNNLSQPAGSEEGITSRYSIAPYVRRMQLDVQPTITISAILLMVALIISVFCNIFMDLRRDRGVRSIAISTLIGTFITFVLAIIIKYINVTESLFVEPGYLYNFIDDHIQWITKVLFVIGLMGAVVGVSLIGTYKGMRRDRN